jgi:hypothetical protein
VVNPFGGSFGGSFVLQRMLCFFTISNIFKLVKALFLASACFSGGRVVGATGGGTISASSSIIGDEIGSGEWKWLSGASVDNKVYGIPYAANQIMMLDLGSGAVSSAGSTDDVHSGRPKWWGAVVVNKTMFGIPAHADRLLIFKPDTGEISGSVSIENVATDFGSVNWIGGLAIDNKVYGVPYYANQILIYDPARDGCD